MPGDSRLLTFTRAGRLDQAGELISVVQRLSLARSLSEVQTIVARAARRMTGADGATFVMRDSDAVLLKPGRLSAPEFEQVKKHPRAGAAILTGSASEVLQLAEEVACTHHE